MIFVEGLCKTFRVAKRAAGFKAAAKSLIKREYNTVEALKDVSFKIGEGEIVGYIGPNGAGKSTTIKIMSGILVPDSGKCEVLGRTPWNDRIEHVKNIGVVFGQRSQLMWDIPVIDSFELLRDIYRVPERKYKQNLDRLSDILDLGRILQTPVRQLSLGQRMRCEITASLLHSPRVLFLDEPTIGLDAVSKVAVRRFIKEINRENGVTVILTTHDMGDVEALADRILLIGKGRILFDGSFEYLKSRYNSTSVLTVDYSGDEKFFGTRSTNGKINSNANNIANSNVYSKINGHAGILSNVNTFPNANVLSNVTVLSNRNGRAVLQVNTKARSISSVISQLSAMLEIHNITVETRPVEEIIVELYKEYKI